MQQPLCHLYFLTVLDNYLLCNSNVDTLLVLATKVQDKALSSPGDEKAILFEVEFQAIIQILIQRLAFHFNPTQSQMLDDVLISTNKINRSVEIAMHFCINTLN